MLPSAAEVTKIRIFDDISVAISASHDVTPPYLKAHSSAHNKLRLKHARSFIPPLSTPPDRARRARYPQSGAGSRLRASADRRRTYPWQRHGEPEHRVRR